MSLFRLDLHQFRNLQQTSIAPCERFNFVVGDNGSGKSSLLEAIHLLGAGRSFRTSRFQHVIQHNESEFALFALVRATGRQHKVGYQRKRSGDMLIRINGETIPRLADMVAKFPLQLLTPESADLLLGGSKHRRQFLDWGLFHHEAQFLSLWKQYERVLKQRNASLRKQMPKAMLAPWEEQFVALSEQVSALREHYMQQLIPRFNHFCALFLDGLSFELSYQAGWDQSVALTTLLEQQYERDRKAGYTHIGPHRGGFRIRQNGIAVDACCSRGQLKLLVAALRLAQGELLAEQKGERCLYLIDDFAAELDEAHRALLIRCLVAIKSQVFITATDGAFVSQVLPDIQAQGEKYKVFHVEHGKLTELNE